MPIKTFQTWITAKNLFLGKNHHHQIIKFEQEINLFFNFQFSDVLLYGSKSPVTQQFKILGHVPLRSLITENAEHNTFVIYGGQRAITVSAGTTAEKTLWLAELSKASTEIKSKPHVQLPSFHSTLKNCSKYSSTRFFLIRHSVDQV